MTANPVSADSSQPGIVEIRVHGIGNKELLDALGHPNFERLSPASEVATAPRVPTHLVRIINWARSNREFTKGFFWYIALPFTLINVVPYMRPSTGRSKYVFPLCGTLAGMVLTAAQLAWGVLLVETVLAHLPVGDEDKGWGQHVPLMIALVMVVIMVYRANKIAHMNDIRDPGPTPMVLALNVATAITFGVTVKPGFEEDTIIYLAYNVPLLEPYVGEDINPMLYWVLGTTLIIYIIAAYLLGYQVAASLKAWWRKRSSRSTSNAQPGSPLAGTTEAGSESNHAAILTPSKPSHDRLQVQESSSQQSSEQDATSIGDSEKAEDIKPEVPSNDKNAVRRRDIRTTAPYGMAAIVLLVTIILLHTLGSLLRIAVGDIMWVMNALAFSGRKISVPDAQTSFYAPAEVPDPQHVKLVDILPVYGVGLFVLLILCWLFVARTSHRLSNRRWPVDAAERAKVMRIRVCHTGRLMPRIAIAFYVLSFVVIYVVSLAVITAKPQSNVVHTLLVVCHFLAYGLILATALGQLPQLTDKAKLVADVVGFWPIRNHPLAGISYQRRVVAGIMMELNRYPDRTVVLVGHSQGSVICAWLIRKSRLPVKRERLHLITCGSPLVSLYQTFFPAYFTNEDFQDVRNKVASWHNFVRATDPIATTVKFADDVWIDDPGPDDVLAKHGNYWIAEKLVRCVEEIAECDALHQDFCDQQPAQHTNEQQVMS